MNDVIKINDLEVYAYHGVYAEENKIGQKFLVSAELYTDFSKAVKDDNLDESIDYGLVCRMITNFLKDNTFRLIETATSRTAQMIMEKFQILKGIKLEIKKPWAPIGLPVNYASVSTELFWHKAYISFGSNLGDRAMYINDALKALNETKGCYVTNVSDIIETEPYGGVDQDSFLNGVLELKTYLSPENLLEELHRIEASANRKREIHWGPRTLDLDIILYDSVIMDSGDLHIPHIDMQNRLFVLEPLCNIAPYVRHPLIGKTAYEMLEELKKQN